MTDIYEKCGGTYDGHPCHLFVERNPSVSVAVEWDLIENEEWERLAAAQMLAPYGHLHRGDAADTALDESHEAKPSGMKANLATWKEYGPLAMRQRFNDYDSTRSPQQREAVAFLADPEWLAAARTWTPAECAASPVGASGVIQRLATALTETI